MTRLVRVDDDVPPESRDLLQAAAKGAASNHLLARGEVPLLCAYVPDAVHWRVVVVGDRAVAAYANPVAADDSRSFGSSDPADFIAASTPRLAALAVAVVRALRVEFGGVDIFVHESGRLFRLEANFPCYFALAETVAGIPVAGAMIDHLLAEARGAAMIFEAKPALLL